MKALADFGAPIGDLTSKDLFIGRTKDQVDAEWLARQQ
jgi:hypothetical protein